MKNNNSVMSMNEFCTYYSRQILELRARLNSTIASILSSSNKSIVNIFVVNKGTNISYVNKKVVNGSFVDYVENICLNIGYEEIKAMYNNGDLSIFEAFNKLVTHEFLHVLFGDFDKTKLNRCFNFYNGSLDEESLKNNPYYEHNANEKYDKEGYKKLEHIVYNIASDFVINRELDIVKPFLRAEDWDLPEDLNVFEYYSILMKSRFESPNEGGLGGNNIPLVDRIIAAIDPLAFAVEDIDGSNGSNTDVIPISNEKMSRITDEDLLEDLFLGKSRGFGPGCIDFVVKSLKKKKSIFFDYTKKIINEIKNDIFNNQNVPTAKIESWQKYNNRKDDSEFIQPGKVTVNDNKSKNFETRSIPVIFIDCSGSMMDILKELFYFCYNILSHINCTLVFYDTKILKVFKCANDVNFNPSMFLGGGTSVKNAIEEYKNKYNENINNIYVFTDGGDDFNNIDIKYLNIYEFSKSGIKKLENFSRGD